MTRLQPVATRVAMSWKRALHGAAAPEPAALRRCHCRSIERRDADHRGGLLARQWPSSGSSASSVADAVAPMPGTDRNMLSYAATGTRLHRGAQLGGRRFEPLLEKTNVGLDVVFDPAVGDALTDPFGGQHLDELSAARYRAVSSCCAASGSGRGS